MSRHHKATSRKTDSGSQFHNQCTDVVLWKPTPAGTPIAAKEVTGLLRVFGITSHELLSPSLKRWRHKSRYVNLFKGQHIKFWDRNIDHRAILERARRNFRSLMKQLRPNVETSQEAIDLIAKWTWLKKLYKQHGIS